MKKENIGFQLGVITWLVVALVTFYNWYQDTPGLGAMLIWGPLPILLVAGLFLSFIIGYALLGDVYSSRKYTALPRLGLIISAFSILILVIIFQYGLIGILAIILVAQLPTLFSPLMSFMLALLIPLIGAIIDVWFKGSPGMATNALLYALFNLFALLASYRFIAEYKAKLQSQQLLRELEATQVLLSATTKRDERLRVARDIHDVLGHHLTALNLQLEVASHVGPEKVNEHVLRAKSVCALLLADVRETVSEFRKEQDVDLNDALVTLCSDIPRVKITLDICLKQPQLNARIAEIVFRCVQEGITNMIKHSNADQGWVSLSQTDQWLLLTIKDNGYSVNHGSRVLVMGNGLKGMEERVIKVDGTMNYDFSNVGFNLNIKLPSYMI